MTRRPTRTLVAITWLTTAVILLIGAASSASAQEVTSDTGLVVRIREAGLDEDGTSRLVVSVTGPAVAGRNLDAGAFRVSEQGQPVGPLQVEPLLTSGQAAGSEPVAVTLLMDVSGSTRGRPLADAQAAASTFVRDLVAQGAQVSVIAFGPAAEVATGLTDDPAQLLGAIGGLEAQGDTALYDAVKLAGDVLAGAPGLHDIVLFSDGADTASTAGIEEAVQAAERAAAPVTAVALDTPEVDRAALDRLARETGGRTLPVTDTGALAGAFEQVAQEIASQYVLTYHGAVRGVDELDIGVEVATDATSAADRIVALNPRPDVAPLAAAPPPPGPLVAAFGTELGLQVGIVAVFVALLALLGTFVVAPVRSASSRNLARGLEVTTRGRKTRGRGSGSALALAANLLERLPSDEQRTSQLQEQLERAGWPLRASELTVLRVAGAAGGALVGGLLLGSVLVAIALAVIGVLAPGLVLSWRVSRRTRAFADQLPDVLQLLAGSLRAGYGLLQAVDTVTREAADPAAGEFGRVLTEARLGGSVETALEAMAARVGSEDFRWVVIAVNIQRQVGGNLAAILETVADTIRERQALRRQVRTLSAEGRLAAAILIALPFFIAGWTAMVNPDYLSVLTSSTMGIAAITLAGALMLLGIVLIRQMIRIDV